jgi:hypothetical protein
VEISYLTAFSLFLRLALDAGWLARSQLMEGPATRHLNTGFSWFSWVLEQMLGWFPFFLSKLPLHASQVALPNYI